MADPISLIQAMQGVYLGESVKKVMLERVEQINKHGCDAEHDSHHVDLELATAAQAVLQSYDGQNDLAVDLWPWENDRGGAEFPITKIIEKSKFDQLAVAGALILAEMDRITKD